MGKASAAQRRAKARPPTKKAEAPRASSADKTEPAEHEDTHTREPESGTPLDAAAPAEPARQQDARHDQQDQGSPERDSASLNSALEARINALQSELDETRQTLAESHAAFAEQIVAMSSQHDQVRADVQAAADTDLATARAEASTAKERVRELEARVAELEQRDTAPAPPVPDKPAPLFPPRPPTETLASFVQALGYADQDYTLLEQLHAAHDAKYTRLSSWAHTLHKDTAQELRRLAEPLPAGALRTRLEACAAELQDAWQQLDAASAEGRTGAVARPAEA